MKRALIGITLCSSFIALIACQKGFEATVEPLRKASPIQPEKSTPSSSTSTTLPTPQKEALKFEELFKLSKESLADTQDLFGFSYQLRKVQILTRLEGSKNEYVQLLGLMQKNTLDEKQHLNFYVVRSSGDKQLSLKGLQLLGYLKMDDKGKTSASFIELNLKRHDYIVNDLSKTEISVKPINTDIKFDQNELKLSLGFVLSTIKTLPGLGTVIITKPKLNANKQKVVTYAAKLKSKASTGNTETFVQFDLIQEPAKQDPPKFIVPKSLMGDQTTGRFDNRDDSLKFDQENPLWVE